MYKMGSKPSPPPQNHGDAANQALGGAAPAATPPSAGGSAAAGPAAGSSSAVRVTKGDRSAVTQYEVAFLVRQYLQDQGFAAACAHFQTEAAELLKPMEGVAQAAKNLEFILNDYITLLEDKVEIKAQLRRANLFATTVSDALDAFKNGGAQGKTPAPAGTGADPFPAGKTRQQQQQGVDERQNSSQQQGAKRDAEQPVQGQQQQQMGMPWMAAPQQQPLLGASYPQGLIAGAPGPHSTNWSRDQQPHPQAQAPYSPYAPVPAQGVESAPTRQGGEKGAQAESGKDWRELDLQFRKLQQKVELEKQHLEQLKELRSLNEQILKQSKKVSAGASAGPAKTSAGGSKRNGNLSSGDAGSRPLSSIPPNVQDSQGASAAGKAQGGRRGQAAQQDKSRREYKPRVGKKAAAAAAAAAAAVAAAASAPGQHPSLSMAPAENFPGFPGDVPRYQAAQASGYSMGAAPHQFGHTASGSNAPLDGSGMANVDQGCASTYLGQGVSRHGMAGGVMAAAPLPCAARLPTLGPSPSLLGSGSAGQFSAASQGAGATAGAAAVEHHPPPAGMCAPLPSASFAEPAGTGAAAGPSSRVSARGSLKSARRAELQAQAQQHAPGTLPHGSKPGHQQERPGLQGSAGGVKPEGVALGSDDDFWEDGAFDGLDAEQLDCHLDSLLGPVAGSTDMASPSIQFTALFSPLGPETQRPNQDQAGAAKWGGGEAKPPQEAGGKCANRSLFADASGGQRREGSGEGQQQQPSEQQGGGDGAPGAPGSGEECLAASDPTGQASTAREAPTEANHMAGKMNANSSRKRYTEDRAGAHVLLGKAPRATAEQSSPGRAGQLKVAPESVPGIAGLRQCSGRAAGGQEGQDTAGKGCASGGQAGDAQLNSYTELLLSSPEKKGLGGGRGQPGEVSGAGSVMGAGGSGGGDEGAALSPMSEQEGSLASGEEGESGEGADGEEDGEEEEEGEGEDGNELRIEDLMDESSFMALVGNYARSYLLKDEKLPEKIAEHINRSTAARQQGESPGVLTSPGTHASAAAASATLSAAGSASSTRAAGPTDHNGSNNAPDSAPNSAGGAPPVDLDLAVDEILASIESDPQLSQVLGLISSAPLFPGALPDPTSADHAKAGQPQP